MIMSKIFLNSKTSWIYAFLVAFFLHIFVLYIFFFYPNTHNPTNSGSFISLNKGEQIKSITIVKNVSIGKLQQTQIDSKKQIEQKKQKTETTKEKEKKIKLKTHKIKSKAKIKKIVKKIKKQKKKNQKIFQKNTSSSSINSKQATTSAPAPLNDNTISSTNLGYSRSKTTSWKAQVMNHLYKYKKYPHEALRNNMEGISKIKIIIDKQGNILNLKIKKSSKHFILDKESLSMLRSASPIPKPPELYFKNKNTLTFTLPIKYDIKEYLKQKSNL